MSNSIEDLRSLHQEVWKVRHKVENNWKIPPVPDALRFAACESCEALDVVLRGNAVYARNHHKAPELEQELSQCTIMLLTALPEDFNWDNPILVKPWGWWATAYNTAKGNGFQGGPVDWLVALVADALQEELWRIEKLSWEEGDIPWQGEFCIIQALIAVGETGIDLGWEVELELNRIEVKYG